MGTTPAYSLPYPEASDPADVPLDMEELATATDGALGALDVRVDALETVSGGAHYGTSPPASPVEGSEWILPVGDGVLWRFRYNPASASAYKWEFVGGAPYHGEVIPAANSHPTPGTWLGATPVLTLPRAGDYMFTFSVSVSATALTALMATIDINNVQQHDLRAGAGPTRTDVDTSFGRASVFVAAIAAAVPVNITIWANTASQPFARRHLSMFPVRVS